MGDKSWVNIFDYNIVEIPRVGQDARPMVTQDGLKRGMEYLKAGNYTASAHQFNRVYRVFVTGKVTPNNVAIYGGLTALATFHRAELYKQVITNARFGLFLELEPELREALQCFHEGLFSQVLNLLKAMRPRLEQDPELYPHVSPLLVTIYLRCTSQVPAPCKLETRFHEDDAGDRDCLAASLVADPSPGPTISDLLVHLGPGDIPKITSQTYGAIIGRII